MDQKPTLEDTIQTDFSGSTAHSLRYIAVFKLKEFASGLVRQPQVVFNNLNKIIELTEKMNEKKINYKFEEFKVSSRISAHVYMDTVTLLSKGNTNVDCLAMLEASSMLFVGAISLNILLTGHISFGHFYINDKHPVFCGTPYIDALNSAKAIQLNALSVDNVVKDNLEEIRNLSKDKNAFSKLGHSLFTHWQTPLYGHSISGASVRKNMVLIDWPRLSLDVFETIKSYSLQEFYEPYKEAYGPLEQLRPSLKAYIEESVTFMNHCLNQTVKMFNSTL